MEITSWLVEFLITALLLVERSTADLEIAFVRGVLLSCSRGQIWRPDMPGAREFYALGQYAAKYKEDNDSVATLHKIPIARTGEADTLKPAKGVRPRASEEGVMFWQLECAEDYIALSAIATCGDEIPQFERYACLHHRFTKPYRAELLQSVRQSNSFTVWILSPVSGETSSFYFVSLHNRSDSEVALISYPHFNQSRQYIGRSLVLGEDRITIVTLDEATSRDDNEANSYAKAGVTIAMSLLGGVLLVSLTVTMWIRAQRKAERGVKRGNTIVMRELRTLSSDNRLRPPNDRIDISYGDDNGGVTDEELLSNASDEFAVVDPFFDGTVASADAYLRGCDRMC